MTTQANRIQSALPQTTELRVKPGLVYFWALNDECADEHIDRYLDAFAAGNVSAVCLHPRAGLLLPYGGDAWFRFVRRTVEQCAKRKLDVWLYDEDPYPSGACGGWITAEHPEYHAQEINEHEADPATCQDGLFGFPTGKLLWCGIVSRDGSTADLTGEVGVVRRKWTLRDPWDSRWYYPATPLYYCARSETREPEFAVQLPRLKPGDRLVAYVANRVTAESRWDGFPDSLNPKATQLFIEMTHERYARDLGSMFGREITAMFTDEPKPFSTFAWTHDAAEAFEAEFGYDIRPRLWHLFAQNESDPAAALTRLHYRQWVNQRFIDAWLAPVSDWCQRHNLPLVGHISPEDDLVQQSATVCNLMPLNKYFSLPGIDLIIPAVGDHQHPLINIGVLQGSSAAQQLNKPGVLSETLACSGPDATAEQGGRILRWQAVMGVSVTVVHAAFSSTQGLRIHEAPPDWGPDSSRWPGMQQVAEQVAELQAVTHEARQEAPVAMLWPIHGFAATPMKDFKEDSPMRDRFSHLVRTFLDRQVGLHLLDEDDLARAELHGSELRLGKARYSHIVLPPTWVWRQSTIDALEQARDQGVEILRVGAMPSWRHTVEGLADADLPWPEMTAEQAAEQLPRLLPFEGAGTDFRCTVWQKDGKRTALLMNLAGKPRTVELHGRSLTLDAGESRILELPSV